jgi:streptogramin lyase
MGTRAGNIAYPVDVAVDAADRVWVAEKGNGRVQVFEQVEGQAPAARPRLPRGRP